MLNTMLSICLITIQHMLTNPIQLLYNTMIQYNANAFYQYPPFKTPCPQGVGNACRENVVAPKWHLSQNHLTTVPTT